MRIWTLAVLVACGGADDADTDPASTTDGPPTSETASAEGTAGDTGASVTEVPTTDPPEVSVGEAPNLLALRLEVALSGAGAAWAACTRDDDPAEVLLAESDRVAAAHTLDVLGAAADTSYTCAVHGPSGGSTEVEVTTPSLPADKGYELAVPAAAGADPFVTLFADLRSCATVATASTHVLMVDHRGEARWLLEVPEPLPSIDLDVRGLADGTIHMSGGFGTSDDTLPHRGIFRTVDRNGEVVVEREEIGFGLGFNHHSEQLPDGTFATLSFDELTDGDDELRGVAIEWWDPATEQVVRTWTSQQLVDEGLHFGDTRHLGIWTANSLELADDPWGQGLYLSVVTADEVWRLDPVTGSLTHRIGPHADWSLLGVDGAPLDDDGWFYFQHDPEITVDGRMLVHDNGTTRGLITESRVLELQLDLDANEAQVLWEWTEPDWGNRFVGDADRLADDTVAVTQGYFGCLSGPDGHSSVVQIDPASDAVVWRLDWDNPDFAPYRSERLDLCEWVPNAADCPEVAARLAELQGAR